QENLLSAERQAASPLRISLRPQQSGSAGAAAASVPPRPSDAVRSEVTKRKPISTVRAPRNAFASLVVDAARNEVIFAEEHNFSVLVYNRLESTRRRAARREPKRITQGENPHLELPSGVYLHPAADEGYDITN